jgi:hypothetical protein
MRNHCLIAIAALFALASELAAQPSPGDQARVAKQRAGLAKTEAAAASERAKSAARQVQLLEQQVLAMSTAAAKLEAEIIAAQADDSPLRIAMVEADLAEADYIAAQEQVLASADYKAAYAAASASSNKQRELPLVRQTFLDRDPAASRAAAERATARKRLEIARQTVFSEHSHWDVTIEQLRIAKAEMVAAKQTLQQHQLAAASASSNYREAAAEATLAAEIAKRSAAKPKPKPKAKAKPKNKKPKKKRS